MPEYLHKVALYVDGKQVEEKTGEQVFLFTVPIAGEHEIRAVSGELTDIIRVRKVAEPNPDYLFVKEAVINWFDHDVFKSDCYSVKDTLGELRQNPEAARVVDELMAFVVESRGDVAKSANKNENLQKIMAGISLEKLIRQGGDTIPPEMVKSVNEALQKIKK